jgi:hypothetical protein
MLNADNEVFAGRLGHDRKLRRLAATLIPELLSVDYDEALLAVRKARKLVHMLEGGAGPRKSVSATAAALYARLPLECPRDALRVLHILDVTLRYIEEGVIDLREASEIAVHIGLPLTASSHLRLNEAANDHDVIIRPMPVIVD